MKTTKRSNTAAIFTTCLLMLSMFAGILVTESTSAESVSKQGSRKSAPLSSQDKIAPELREMIGASAERQGRVKVILQLSAAPSDGVKAILKRDGVRINGTFENFNAMAAELPASAVAELADYHEVSYISLDGEVRKLGHVSATTGADAVRSSVPSQTSLDGTGIGIAVLDSGIFKNHEAFRNGRVISDNHNRIVYEKDFTGEMETKPGEPSEPLDDDVYGHGTHVAAVAGGNGRIANANYVGIAPNANLLNLRVLNIHGKGTVARVLSALNWVMTNRTNPKYNIRIVNMSLGMLSAVSYKNDPLCKAVRRLVDAGVVVVAAAGNNGKDSNGNKMYGLINTPGNEPSAITVGATNTFGTNGRADDGITTYSSRGPTRSFWTDSNRVRHHDNLMKPDLVAPGNKIISAKAKPELPGVDDCELHDQNPQMDSSCSTKKERDTMLMNGTSVAAPVVAGAVALLLQVNPNLTPNLVKAILMWTAQPLRDFNMLEQGAGQLNIEGGVRLAKLIRTDLSATTPLGSSLLKPGAKLPTARTTIGGQSFTWAQGFTSGQVYVRGNNLILKYQKVYALGRLLSDGVLASDNGPHIDSSMMTNGVLASDNIVTSDGTILGRGDEFLASGVLASDDFLMDDGTIAPDGVLASDQIRQQSINNLINGDSTSKMPLISDTGDYPKYY